MSAGFDPTTREEGGGGVGAGADNISLLNRGHQVIFVSFSDQSTKYQGFIPDTEIRDEVGDTRGRAVPYSDMGNGRTDIENQINVSAGLSPRPKDKKVGGSRGREVECCDGGA